MRDGLGIYGGFAGDETTLEERDPVVNVTTLSGDLSGNDVHDFFQNNTTFDENSYHVLVAEGVSSSAVLDGVTVTGGNAYWVGVAFQGGGLLNESASPTLSNCTFAWNRALDGGGIANFDSDPTITDCDFVSNGTGDRGGGMFNLDSDPIIENCSFTDNDILYSLALGTAMFNINSSPRGDR